MNLANLLANMEAFEEAKDEYQNAISLRQGIRTWCDKSGEVWTAEYQNNLAATYMNLALLFASVGAFDEAKIKYQQSISLDEGICAWCYKHEKEWPILYRHGLTVTYMNYAVLLGCIGALEEAKEQYKQAFTVLDSIHYCFTTQGKVLALDVSHTDLLLWCNYISVADPLIISRFIELASESIRLLDMHTDIKSQGLSLKLLHRMAAFSLKNNEISLALKLIHCVQGRELAYKLEASQLTGNEPEVV
ncbi:hypothetical protein H5154_22365, partial [Pseudoalteromonas sp. SR44-5]|uniref:hypothetical protein n=1 Tax=Pseudoalteromonas sp. SR44-5 TaxID=2760934 RepID=UPI00183537A4